MAKAHIHLPEHMDTASVFAFIKELDFYAANQRLVIDCSGRAFFSPFSLLVISGKLNYLRQKNPDLQIKFVNYAEHSHAGHMGFFRMAGYAFGREVGEAWGSEDYLPITCLNRDSLYQSPTDKYQELPDLIQRHANSIAVIFSRGEYRDNVLYDVLSYSIREMMRNVFEHSGATNLHYCVQHYPKINKVEFAIIDFGDGIRRGLGTNPNFRFKDDKTAIEYSLLPSVSGKTHLARTSSTWFNSGYGLYMTSRLARNGGNFVIASGMSGIHLSMKTKNNFSTSFPGTALRFNMNVKEIGDVSRRLKEYQREGHEIAKSIAGSGNRPPSAMSLLLRRDFEQSRAKG